MSWVGGKKALRDQIVARFPLDYQRYIEVFGGAGWVLFHKPPGNDFEIYNDFDSNLVNLYRCVRDHSEGLVSELMFMLNSREDFEYMKDLVHSKADLPDIRRAAYYYALIRYGYSARVDYYGGQPHVVASYMSDKAFQRQSQKLLEQAKNIAHPRKGRNEHSETMLYNSMVIGLHEYYRVATNINLDCERIYRSVMTVLTNRLRKQQSCRLVRKGRPLTKFEVQKFGNTRMMRYVPERFGKIESQLRPRDIPSGFTDRLPGADLPEGFPYH